MKRLAAAFTLILLLAGCAGKTDDALSLRQNILNADLCGFQAKVTADYGDTLSVFTLDCLGDQNGDLRFTVTAPESIQGITGTSSAGKGKLTFDDKALSFPLMADGLLSPVSGPWVLLRALRSGNLTSAGTEGSLTRLTIDDSFQADALQADLWLENGVPIRAELCCGEQKFLSMELTGFRTESKNGA